MPDSPLHPSRSSITYAVRAPLAAWLQERSRGRPRAPTGATACSTSVAAPDRTSQLFARRGATYIGCDVEGSRDADIHGYADALPVEDGSFDVVLCTQVLEHVPDPAAAVRELRRAC